MIESPSIPQLTQKQQWVMDQLRANVKLTRQDVERQFDIRTRTAKRVLGELSDAGHIEFNRTSQPGFCRVK